MIYTLTRGIATDVGVTLLDSADAAVTGALIANIQVLYRKNGASTFVEKTVLAGEWNEVGDGIYKLTFTAGELDTAGYFRILVKPVSSSFLRYEVDLSLLDDYKSLADQVIAIKQSLASKVNIADADTLIAQRELRLKSLEQQAKELLTRLKRAEQELAALRAL